MGLGAPHTSPGSCTAGSRSANAAGSEVVAVVGEEALGVRVPDHRRHAGGGETPVGCRTAPRRMASGFAAARPRPWPAAREAVARPRRARAGRPRGRLRRAAGAMARPLLVARGHRPLDPGGQRGHDGVGQAARSGAARPRRPGRRAGLAAGPTGTMLAVVRIRAVSVFEGVVYHCWCVDPTSPCRPTLEVEAVLRPGDADAEAGPLLLSVADYVAMAGGPDRARPCLDQLRQGVGSSSTSTSPMSASRRGRRWPTRPTELRGHRSSLRLPLRRPSRSSTTRAYPAAFDGGDGRFAVFEQRTDVVDRHLDAGGVAEVAHP